MLHVLYIDDEPDLLDVGKTFLEETGEFRVDSALSAHIGQEMLERTKYDAVVCDYQMPGMDGISLLKTLRSKSNTIPFI
ncbi:MAG: response regulator, partial [Methanoregula sp.]